MYPGRAPTKTSEAINGVFSMSESELVEGVVVLTSKFSSNLTFLVSSASGFVIDLDESARGLFFLERRTCSTSLSDDDDDDDDDDEEDDDDDDDDDEEEEDDDDDDEEEEEDDEEGTSFFLLFFFFFLVFLPFLLFFFLFDMLFFSFFFLGVTSSDSLNCHIDGIGLLDLSE